MSAILVALTVAAQAAAAPSFDDSVRESEAERLKRLNEEVARIADLLARLSRDAPSPSRDVEDRRQQFDVGPATHDAPLDPCRVGGGWLC